MSKSRFSVKTTDIDITIYYDGHVVLYWCRDEWEEDSSVVISMVNAVIQAYTEPDKLYEYLEKLNQNN